MPIGGILSGRDGGIVSVSPYGDPAITRLLPRDRPAGVRSSGARLVEPIRLLTKPPSSPNNKADHCGPAFSFGGEGGIRTLGRFEPTPDFESGTFDHSATSPEAAILTASRAILLGA